MADKKNDPGYLEIKVLMEVSYYVPLINETQTKVNGWTADEVKDDWFVRHNINGYHCARDASQIGGSKVIKDIEVIKHGS